MRKKNFIIIFILLACLAVGLGCIAEYTDMTEEGEQYTVVFNDSVLVKAEKVSGEKAAIGLSGRNYLNEGEGMLFESENVGADGDGRNYYTIWMKAMKFSIDIIWIADEEIVHIIENAPVPYKNYISAYSLFFDAGKVLQVLEVSAGFVERSELKIGDKVKINESTNHLITKKHFRKRFLKCFLKHFQKHGNQFVFLFFHNTHIFSFHNYAHDGFCV